MMSRFIFPFFALLTISACRYSSFSSAPQEWNVSMTRNCPDMCLYQSRDSAVFHFTKGTLLTSGMDTINPLSFKINLPPGVISYRALNSRNFEFFYKRNKAIVVRNSYDQSKKAASQQAELVALPEQDISKWSTTGLSMELDLLLNKNNGRITKAYSKGDILIGVVNIREREVAMFENFISSIEIID